jgi:nucleoside-diphosphate-sugar epimerase|tara:strand:+ start:5237 stop:6142 length:906 start_codon:yes stop_codon:yes gene_type:complete
LNKNVFITGGSGQDGQILTILLKKKKINLTILYKGKKPKKQNDVNYIKENLSNKKKIGFLFKKIKPDIVLHLAANNPSYNEKNYKIFFKENFSATKNIFYATFEANNKARFIFCSSSKIFQKKRGIVNERSKTISQTDYTRFRIKSDLMMLKFKRKEKINYTNAILFNHDSIFRNKKFLLPRIISAVIKGDTTFLNDIIKANIISDFSHAEDICRGLCKIMFSIKNFDKLILSSGKSTSINNIIKYIIRKNKLKLDINLNQSVNKKTLVGSNKFANKKLGWFPKKNIYIAANEIYRFTINK